MRLTIIHPCIGRREGQRYMRGWQMEPLPAALIAGLTPNDVDIRFYDDRMEKIPFEEPTDLVALSVETYTARRSYQIASEFRRRGIPVVMGGFHATLCPEEVAEYAESVVVGEAESSWSRVIDDYRSRTPEKFYRQNSRPALTGLKYDRRIFEGKRYLPIGLVEAGRGCHFTCEFCAIQSVFSNSHVRRPIGDVISELKELRKRNRGVFFVDDNFASNIPAAKEFLRELFPLKLKWVTQMSIDAAHDEEFLDLLSRSGCQGVLIGFESTNTENLRSMNKSFATGQGGFEPALEKLKKYKIRVYATFVFGYDHDTPKTFDETLDFALRHKFYIAAFNHLTPFPGTPLMSRLKRENRILSETWWMDESYTYNVIPFQPKNMTPDELQSRCVETRRKFYSIPNIFRRSVDPVNRSNAFMFSQFFPINFMHLKEVSIRNFYPLGDETWSEPLLKAQ